MNLRLILTAFAVLLSVACTGNVSTELADTCVTELGEARQELEEARNKGLAGRIQWIKAANLLSSANARQQIGKYDSCVEKVRRARIFIEAAEQQP